MGKPMNWGRAKRNVAHELDEVVFGRAARGSQPAQERPPPKAQQRAAASEAVKRFLAEGGRIKKG